MRFFFFFRHQITLNNVLSPSYWHFLSIFTRIIFWQVTDAIYNKRLVLRGTKPLCVTLIQTLVKIRVSTLVKKFWARMNPLSWLSRITTIKTTGSSPLTLDWQNRIISQLFDFSNSLSSLRYSNFASIMMFFDEGLDFYDSWIAWMVGRGDVGEGNPALSTFSYTGWSRA